MPERNGLATLTHIRNHFSGSRYPLGLPIPVMIATGLRSDRLKEIAESQHIDDYIEKPFDSRVLVKKIEAILAQHQA